MYEECIGEVLSDMQLKNYVKLLVIDGMRELKTLQPDVKVNGIESGKLKLEDTLQHTIEKEDTSDVNPMLGVLKNEDINEFNYWQPNAYGLTVKLFF